MRQENDGIFYWDHGTEIDLLIRQGIKVERLIQVVYEGLDDEKTFNREVRSLIEANEVYPKAEKIIVAAKIPQVIPEHPDYIKIVPMWKLLLNTI